MVSSGLLLRCQTRYVSESFLRVGSLEEDRNVAGCVESECITRLFLFLYLYLYL